MQINGKLRRSAAIAGATLGLLFSTVALANKDILYPSGATATVSGSDVAVTNNFTTGSDGSTTLNGALFAGQAVVVTATWSIQDRSAQPGSDTTYGAGLLVTFTSSTTQTPGPAVSITAIPNCTVTSAASTCQKTVSFTAPATPGNYQVKVLLGGTGFTGSGGLTNVADEYFINFSVSEPVVVLLDTKLTVAQKCALLNAGDVSLSAKLEELVSTDPIAGATIDFFVNPELDQDGNPTVPSVGNGVTSASGTATLTYNVNGLGVGDHNLYAEYAGSDDYNPSNDSDILGISYLFVGFQQPINPEGNSVFGNGRVIPIKIKLADANGNPVADAEPKVYVTTYSSSTGLGDDLEPASSVSAADTGNVMRYVPEDEHYIYNWDLSNLANGTYGVVVDLGDSQACGNGPYYAVITVAKKGKK
jgi:hypothetical protein